MKRPAVIAGWVGVGVAVIVVLSFELVFAVQAIVFLLALPVGLLIGYHANARDRSATALAAEQGSTAGRRLGWGRSVANGLVAGLMTGIALAVLYVLIRLVFFYLDTGFRAGGPPYSCTNGPDCTYQRSLDDPNIRAALENAGVHDAAGYTGFFLESQALGGGTLVALVLGGSLAGSVLLRVSSHQTPPLTTRAASTEADAGR